MAECIKLLRLEFAAYLKQTNSIIIHGRDWKELHDNPHVELRFLPEKDTAVEVKKQPPKIEKTEKNPKGGKEKPLKKPKA